MIEIKDLSIDLGEFFLKDVNMTITDGEYFVILGPTGAGKTVLIECIAGIHRLKQGEIWFVSFIESVGHEFKKDRPALIVQANDKLRTTDMITIIPLTSNIKNKYNDDIIVKKTEENGLYYDSVLKVCHLKSFDRSRFIKRIGVVNNVVIETVKQYLKKHFGI